MTADYDLILSLVSHALPAMLNGHDTETLAANELLVRICPDTKRPVLVCHNGNGQCLCLHNGTTEEDAVDVDLWLRSNGRECNGYNKLQEAVVDLAYNAGADNLWEDRDSRAVNAEIVQWAEEFETEHAGTDWDAEDYFLAIDRFYKEKTATEWTRKLQKKSSGKTVIRPDMTYKTICLTMRILCFLWRTERSCLMTSTSGKNVPTSNLKKSWTGTTGPRLVDIRLKTGI